MLSHYPIFTKLSIPLNAVSDILTVAHAIDIGYDPAQRNDPDPDLREELPPEIAGANHFPLPLHLSNQPEDLVSPDPMLDR